jgi:catechol 2,3-dioxygenase-like lactoylglutathione lyase family enzyme
VVHAAVSAPISFWSSRHPAPLFDEIANFALGSSPVKQSIGLISLVVRDYDEALGFFVGKLGFELQEDTAIEEENKRWVVVSPRGALECRILLARASDDRQCSRIGNQTGGRVFLFLHTDDVWRDFAAFSERGVTFVREPRAEPYGIVAVFEDIYGNLWDLLQPSALEVATSRSPLCRS